MKLTSGGGGILGGKKSKGASQPTNFPDTLRQHQKVSLLYLIGQGQCKGFPSSEIRKHIYLDGVPVMSSSGVLNYTLDVDYRLGAIAQTTIPGFGQLSQASSVGVRLYNSLPIERPITDTATDAFKLSIRVPQLQQQKDNGDVVGASVQWQVSVSSAGGPYVVYATETANEKSSGPFVRDTIYALQGVAPWVVRVERLTPDSVSDKLQNETNWDILSEIKWDVGSFNEAALFAARNVDAREFSSLPEITLDWLGREMLIPLNYDGLTRTYTGGFAGDMKTAYTDDLAWCLYDLLNDPITCAGVPDQYLSVYDFYELSQWCNSFEPKLRLTANITTQAEARELIQSVASRMYAIMMSNGNSVVPIIDNVPTMTKAIFGNSNTVEQTGGFVEAGNFNYTRTSIQARPGVCYVTYQDKANFGEAKIKRVEYAPAIAFHNQRGTNVPEVDLTAFGCSDESEATTYALYHLITSYWQKETCAFETGPEGQRLMPGDHISVFDNTEVSDSKQGAGRLMSASLTGATGDRPYTFTQGIIYSLQVYNPAENRIEAIALTNPGTSTATLTFLNAIAFELIPGSQYVINASNLASKQYRVLEATEDVETGVYTISGVNVLPDKWSIIAGTVAPAQPATNILPNPFAIPPMPSQLTATSAQTAGYRSNGYLLKVNLLWHIQDSEGIVREFYIESKRIDEPGSSWKPLTYTDGPYFAWSNVQPGSYAFRVQSLSIGGKRSPFSYLNYEVRQEPPLPSDVQNFSYSLDGAQLLLSWRVVPDVDVVNAGTYVVKFLPNGGGAFNFNSGVYVGGDIPGNASSVRLPAKAGIYQIVARNSQGQVSAIAASITVAAAAVSSSQNLLLSIDDSTTNFTGIRTDTVRNANNDLVLAYAASGAPNVKPYGTYASTAGTVNFGRLTPIVLDILRRGSIIEEANFWDSTPGLFDDGSGEFLLGGNIDGANTYVEVQLSTDGVNYGDWQRLYSERVTLRFWRARLRLALESSQPTKNTVTEELTFNFEAAGPPVATSLSINGWKLVTFASPYNAPPEVNLYALAGATYAVGLRNVTTTGFEFSVTDAGAFVAGAFVKYNVNGF